LDSGAANPEGHGLVERYQALLRVNDVISRYRDLGELFHHITACLRSIVSFEVIGVGLYDAEQDLMRAFLLSGEIPAELNLGVTVPPDMVPARRVMESQQPYIFRVDQGTEYPFHRQRMRESGAKISYHFPLSTSLTRIGVLALGSSREAELNAEEMEFLQQVANQVAIAIENVRNFEQNKALQEKLAQEKMYLEDEIRSETNFDEIIGQSPVLKAALKQVETVAPSDATVLILGETGTGKELVARAIHHASRRNERTFVKMNCAAIPTGLLESELFGHERGAFTGAIAQKIGRLELANGGSLFLDEVGDIPLELQPKLLRAIQEREFERLGSTRTQKVDVRLVAATHRNLQEMVDAREFRSDLYYRLKVFPITIPPLRERADDIPRLVRYFVTRYAKRMDKKIDSVPAETMKALQRWHWPGNVRELENFMERSVILTTGFSLNAPTSELFSTSIAAPASAGTLESTERDHILKVLRETKGTLAGPTGAAARLGLKRTTLQYKMKKLGITRNLY